MYTYGRNRRTHNAILILVKRILTLMETTFITGQEALLFLSDDEQIHPVLRANIKEAESRKSKEKKLWVLFWSKEDIFNPILRRMMVQSESSFSDSHQILRAVLSLAAFEEGKLDLSQTYNERLEDSDIVNEDTWSV